MNYYLVPTSIAESLQLTRIRKSSAGGFYLLSEYDLQPYGIERAIGEGATELSENHTPVPVAEPEQPQEELSQGDQSQENQPEVVEPSPESQPEDGGPSQEEQSDEDTPEEPENEVEGETNEEEES